MHRAYFALRMADQWLSWRLDMIASFLILIVALLAISQRDHINPSLTAVSLTQVPCCCWQAKVQLIFDIGRVHSIHPRLLHPCRRCCVH